MQKLFSASNFMSPTKIEKLYWDYTQIVKTNITNDEMLGMANHAMNIKDIFSFGYTTDCSNSLWKFSVPACFLYPPDRSLFAWASVMIPVWAEPSNVNFYDYTKKFAFYVMHNQEYLLEKAKIVIQNWIDKNYAKQQNKKTNGYANQIASKLRKFAFDIINVENAIQASSGTIVYFVGTGKYTETVDTLKYFLPIDKVVTNESLSWVIITNTTWAEIVVVLWNSYVDYFDPNTFSYYK
jgi:hypothetical protein